MPLMRSTRKGKPCFRWGTTGKCYAYDSGDASTRARARRKAMLQGRAIEASKARRRK